MLNSAKCQSPLWSAWVRILIFPPHLLCWRVFQGPREWLISVCTGSGRSMRSKELTLLSICGKTYYCTETHFTANIVSICVIYKLFMPWRISGGWLKKILNKQKCHPSTAVSILNRNMIFAAQNLERGGT